MPAGRVYFQDYGFPHTVFNWGKESRVHLVLDVVRAAPAGRHTVGFKEKTSQR